MPPITGQLMAHDDTDRRRVNVKICAESWAGWDRLARSQGVTLAALLDAIGHQLAQLPTGAKAPLAGPAGELAREIDAERRRRA